MIRNELQKSLEMFWDLETGFFFKLRNSAIDLFEGEKLLSYLEGIDFSGESSLDKEIVRLLWYIPLFMSWQFDRLSEIYARSEMNKYEELSNKISSEVERILGVP